jgi:hypothetical protein
MKTFDLLIKLTLVIGSVLTQIVSFAGTYNGPTDPKYYRQPKDLICQGLPDYPRGANLTFPKGASVGNLLDGFSYPYPEGKIGIMYFQDMSISNTNTLTGFVTTIDVLNDFHVRYKELPVKCLVKKWY